MLMQQIINGLTVGSVYAIIAIGYTMVYGILELINFAHGEIYMIGAYLGIIFLGLFSAIGLTASNPALAVFLSLALTIIFASAYGFAMEKIAYKPLRYAPRLSPFISAIGVSIFLQNYVMLTQGATDKVFPMRFGDAVFQFLNVNITYLQAAIIAVSAALMLALHLFVQKTRIGKAMRATAQDGPACRSKYRQGYISNIHNRSRTRRNSRHDGGVILWTCELLYRIYSRHKGIYRRSAGRDRQSSWRYDWRYRARSC